jgi:arylsulfatase A-like enzyme
LDLSRHRVFTNGIRYQESNLTLAEFYRSLNYQTAAFISGYSLIDRVSGLGRGFQVFDDRWSEKQVERSCKDTTEAFIQWLKEVKTPAFFAWIHLFDPHSPYEPGKPFDQIFVPEGLAPKTKASVAREKQSAHDQNVKNAMKAGDFGVLVKDPTTTITDSESLAWNIAQYQGEIRKVDISIRRILDALSERNLLDRSILVITADHGEGFDHDYFFGHGDRLWESAISVPWMIHFPKEQYAGQVCSAPAIHQDLLPTLASLLQMPSPLFDSEGENLEFLIKSKLPRAQLSWFAFAPPLPRKNLSQGMLAAIYDRRFKLIRNQNTGKSQLFDVASDPAETHDVYDRLENQSAVYRLERLLSIRLEKSSFPTEAKVPDISENEARKLKQLGYISDDYESQ